MREIFENETPVNDVAVVLLNAPAPDFAKPISGIAPLDIGKPGLALVAAGYGRRDLPEHIKKALEEAKNLKEELAKPVKEKKIRRCSFDGHHSI